MSTLIAVSAIWCGVREGRWETTVGRWPKFGNLPWIWICLSTLMQEMKFMNWERLNERSRETTSYGSMLTQRLEKDRDFLQ